MDDSRTDDWQPETIELELTDVLDLHSFLPSQVRQIVADYLDLACEAEFDQVRIVHGRGRGVQRRMVRSLLESDPRVSAFGDAPGGAGGWGATIVQLSVGRG